MSNVVGISSKDYFSFYNLCKVPSGSLHFIADDVLEDIAEEADEAVIVGGEGDAEKWADTSGKILFCWVLFCV